MTPTVKIITDGSCRRNPGGPGGWAIKTPSLVVVYSDCKYITDAFKKGWIKNGVKHGNLREGVKENWEDAGDQRRTVPNHWA